MREIDKSRLISYCGSVSEAFMKEVDRSLKAALGIGHKSRPGRSVRRKGRRVR